MSDSLCAAGPVFTLVGDEINLTEWVSFTAAVDAETAGPPLRFEWYIDGLLVVDQLTSTFTVKIPEGIHRIAARILTLAGWSGLRHRDFVTVAQPVSAVITGPDQLEEGFSATYQVIGTFADQIARNITDRYVFSIPEGRFQGSTLYTGVSSSDTRSLVISASTGSGVPLTKSLLLQHRYFNQSKSQNFVKNNCAAGYDGAQVPYVVAAGLHTSLISQEDADQKAQAQIDQNGQAFADSQDGNYCIATDAVPDAFSFTQIMDAEINTAYQSNAVTISGLTLPSPVTISRGEYCINSGNWTNQQQNVNNGDQVVVRAISSGSYEVTSTAQLTIGGVSAEFWITTKPIYYNTVQKQDFVKTNCGQGYAGHTVTYEITANAFTSFISVEEANQQALNQIQQYGQAYADSQGLAYCTAIDAIPDAFFFNTINNAEVNTAYESQNITITGLTLPSAIGLSNGGGAYRINNGPWLATASEVNNGDQVTLRLTSAAGYQETTETTLTIGGVNAVFAVTTKVIFWNSEQQQGFYRNNCGPAYLGTQVTYQVPAGKYYSFVSVAEANQQAINEITQQGQVYANAQGSCYFHVEPPSVLVVDIYGQNNYNLVGIIENAEIAQHHQPVYTGSNILPSGSQPQDALMLASDLMPDSPRWRFEFNVAKLIDNNPGSADFTFYIKGRANAAGQLNGAWSLKGPGGKMSLLGGSGFQVPSVTGASADTVPLTNFASMITAGASGNYSESYLLPVLKLVYHVTSQTITASRVWANSIQSQAFTKNNCQTGSGTSVNYTIAANTYLSYNSQQEADDLAMQDIAANGQAYANATGSCSSETYYIWLEDHGAGSDHYVWALLRDADGNPVEVNQDIHFYWAFANLGSNTAVLTAGISDLLLTEFIEDFKGNIPLKRISGINPSLIDGHPIRSSAR
jgi:hypothetical protein